MVMTTESVAKTRRTAGEVAQNQIHDTACDQQSEHRLPHHFERDPQAPRRSAAGNSLYLWDFSRTASTVLRPARATGS